ncbi:hypothetical protein LDENG_00281560 [Lucifuga dentata]|nr:hypothetical protein LDENG_00281560 [Lucifuga dentata]
METSKKRQNTWRSAEELLKGVEDGEQNKEEGVLVLNLGREMEVQVEMVVPDTEDEEEDGCTPLITACRKGMTEVVQRLLRTGADLTLCNCYQQTALHISPPELQRKVLGWMFRPHLPPQAQLLQAAWQGDMHALQHLLTQTDMVDVNVPNSDGVTAVMLAIRDIDLFEGTVTPLPWEHRPVEVVMELLSLSADLRVRDHNGCSAFQYAVNINSPLKEDIIHMMFETLKNTDTAPVSPQALDKYLCQEFCQDSELGDLDLELDLESFCPNPTVSPSLTLNHQHRFALHSHTEDVLESPECLHLSEHHKGLSQGSPSANKLCCLLLIRRVLSLASLSEKSRCRGHVDPVASSNLLSIRSPRIPVPPRNRPRTKSDIAGSPSSTGLLSVAQPCLLSQSAPSIMEPLLHSNTVVQARAHIQTRLGSHETANDQKFSQHSFPAPHLKALPRTPKLLAPLDGRSKDHVVPPEFKHHAPLKPISQSPLLCRSHLRRNRLHWCSLHNGPPTNKGGSEDSGSCSSSQSSIDLEDEEKEDGRNLHEKTPEDRDRLSRHLRDVSSSEAYADCSERSYKTEIQDVAQAETTMKDVSDEEADRPMLSSMKELNTTAAAGKNLPFTTAVNLILSEVDPQRGERMITPIKPVQNKERRACTNYEQRPNIHTKQSFSALTHKDKRQWNKSKSNLRLTTIATQVKPKAKKSPDLSDETTVSKVKSRLDSVKGAHRNTDTPSPQKQGELQHPQNTRTNPDKNKNTQQQLPVRELKTARQLKRQGVAGISRSKSAVDFITYKDMFQEIQSGDEGPAIFEMFAGPIYDNLRVSSSCEKHKDRQVQSASCRKIKHCNKVKHRPLKKQAESGKLRRNPMENMAVSAKIKLKPVSSRAKPRLKSISRKGKYKMEGMPKLDKQRTAELALSKDGDMSHNRPQDRCEDHMLSTIEESPSHYGSETLKPDGKTIPRSTTYSRDEDYYHQMQVSMQETAMNSTDVKTHTANPNQLIPAPVLPTPHYNPLQLKINTWTSGSSSTHTLSPVYQRFLDDVGEGPLTDDLLQCLAEELISLDERDVSIGLCAEKLESSRKESSRDDSGLRRNAFPEATELLDCRFVGGDTITWTKGEILGRGAYGTVYCGLTSQGQLIAVKQVSLDTSDPEAAEREYSRLQGEVKLLKTLTHSNIVGFLGTSLHQHMASIFMEYIPGGSIASIIHRFGPLPERILALYTHQILEGVAYLHLNRVIHRDLKGNNIMLMPTGIIKLIDFGCARRLSCLNHTSSNSGDLLKSVHGTPYWMAPEVISETGYGSKSDIWSVGCTVFEMATGKPPLAHMDKMAALFYIGARRGLMPSLPDGFSDSAKDFVKICLTSDQRLRPSADQLLKHSFTPTKETGMNSLETKRKGCCGHPQGLCG